MTAGLAALLFSAAVQGAEEPQLVATLDKDQAYVNEEVHLNIKVMGIQSGVQAPVLPPLNSFDVFYSGRSSRFSFVNGRSESLTEFNYVLIPRSAGRFVIEPIEVRWSGQAYRTQRLEIEIFASQQLGTTPGTSTSQLNLWQAPGSSFQTPQAGGTGPAAQPVMEDDPRGASGPDPNIFLAVRSSKFSVFTNEQLILDYSIFTRYDTRYEGFEEEPETSGFWIEEFPLDYQNIGKEMEVVNGKKYVRADIKRLALFPTAPGSYVIKPGRVKTSVQIQERTSSLFDEFFSDSFFTGSGLFARRAVRILTAAPIEMTVKPLPEAGKPTSFKGAVGEFRMSTEVDKKVIVQNEAVTLKLMIEGQGNIETLSLPSIPEPPKTKVYESDSSRQLYRERDAITGSRSFEVILIPSEAGELVIPSIEFSFFNPRTERYVVLKSEPYRIHVSPSLEKPAALADRLGGRGELEKKTITLESEDIYFIREEIDPAALLTSRRAWLILLGVDGGISMLILALWMASRRRAFFEAHEPLKRVQRARKDMQKGINALARLLRSSRGTPESAVLYFDRCSKLLNAYLAAKLHLSPHGMTHRDIDQALSDLAVSDEVIRKIHECYDACDEVRFGHLVKIHEKQKDMVEHLRIIFEALEKHEKLKGSVFD